MPIDIHNDLRLQPEFALPVDLNLPALLPRFNPLVWIDYILLCKINLIFHKKQAK